MRGGGLTMMLARGRTVVREDGPIARRQDAHLWRLALSLLPNPDVYRQPPANLPDASPLGLSVARVMGDELVVETSRIDYHSFGDLGPAQSDRSHVVERFKLSADGLRLDYDITVTDPVILAEPWSWGGSFILRDGAELKKWNCGVE